MSKHSRTERAAQGLPASRIHGDKSDVLVAVDRRPARWWTLAALQERFAGSRTPVVLEVERDSRRRSVRIALRDLL